MTWSIGQLIKSRQVEQLPPLIIGDEEVEMIVSAFGAVMAEVMSVCGRVWAQSAQLIKHALGG